MAVLPGQILLFILLKVVPLFLKLPGIIASIAGLNNISQLTGSFDEMLPVLRNKVLNQVLFL